MTTSVCFFGRYMEIRTCFLNEEEPSAEYLSHADIILVSNSEIINKIPCQCRAAVDLGFVRIEIFYVHLINTSLNGVEQLYGKYIKKETLYGSKISWSLRWQKTCFRTPLKGTGN